MRKLTIILVALVIAVVAGSSASATSTTVKVFKAHYYVMPKEGVAVGVGSANPYLLNLFFATARKPWRALFSGYTSNTPPNYPMRCAWGGHSVLIALYARRASDGKVICREAAPPLTGNGWTRVK